MLSDLVIVAILSFIIFVIAPWVIKGVLRWVTRDMKDPPEPAWHDYIDEEEYDEYEKQENFDRPDGQ